MEEELYIKTLLHELTHLRQWVVGSLRLRSGKMYYGKECMENVEYWYQAHEIEAREQEETLYAAYMKDVKGTYVDDTVTFTCFTRPRHLL